MTAKKLGLLALAIAAAVLWALPAASIGRGLDLAPVTDGLRQTTQQLGENLDKTAAQTRDALRKAAGRTGTAIDKLEQRRSGGGTRATATDPATQPPLHATNPHGQGSVGIVDLNPSAERPLGGSPDGSDAGPEEAVIGRARGEQQDGGSYHGHITILALFGNELAGVDSTEGQTSHGPLQPIQTGILDPLCMGTAQQVCLSVLTADSSTTGSGSTNDFAVARAKVGSLGVGAAESTGTISEDSQCQTSAGGARTANVSAGGGAVAQVANSSSTSKSCRGQAPQVTNTSQVIALGGVQIPLPSAGCGAGTADTVTGIPGLLPIVCNADDVAGAAGVREALDVFVLSVGGTSLAKETTAASEALSVAPAEAGGPACSDRIDNDGDGLIDAADPGCHSDGNPNNPASYNPSDTDESDSPTAGSGGPGAGGKPQCSDGRDNDGDGLVDSKDPGCHSDGNPGNPASYNPKDDDESNGPGGGGRPQCSDRVDNDGDGVIDSADPGCHSDGNPNNPASYNPNDDDESNGGPSIGAKTLPFTGTDVVGLALAGLLVLAGGLLLRRREDALASR